jgi:hypothetical protein
MIAMIGKCAKENPELSFDFIKGTLLALEEVKRGDVEDASALPPPLKIPIEILLHFY